MRIDVVLAERSRVRAAMTKVEKDMRDIQIRVATRAIGCDRADLVLAECREEFKQLKERLRYIDETLSQPQGNGTA